MCVDFKILSKSHFKHLADVILMVAWFHLLCGNDIVQRLARMQIALLKWMCDQHCFMILAQAASPSRQAARKEL